jgi:hypothetical protein
MADKKISALTAASTPLAGTEVLPIVQSGATVKVAVSDLTAGRAISATAVTASTGNFVVGTSGQGVDFSATPSTGTSELLADYEEGTWTPTVFGSTSAGTATYTLQVGRYTKIGNTVVCHANVGISAHTGTGNVRLGGLPFTSANVSNIAYAGSIAELGNLTLTALNVATLYLAQNETAIYVIQYPVGGGAASGVAMDSEFNIAFSITYQAA